MTDRVSLRFQPSHESASWADDAAKEFHAAAATFFQNDATCIVTEVELDSGDNVQKVRLKSPLPKSLRRKATESLTAAKHAFDQATFAARNLCGPAHGKSVYFPWAQNPTDLRRALENRGIDERLWSVFEAHAPYKASDAHPAGNDVVRELATLANRKHTLGLAVAAHIVSVGFPSVKTGAVKRLTIPMPVWDSVKNEAELIRWNGDATVYGNYNFTFQILLQDPGLTQPVNAADALAAFATKAKAVAQDLETRCRALL